MKSYKILLCTFLVSCTAAKFKAPEVYLPSEYLNQEVATKGDTTLNIEWWDNFQDTTLTNLITEALLNNCDIEIALSQLEQAKLQLRNANTAGTPEIGLSLTGKASQTENQKVVKEYALQPTLSWEIDFFGKLRYAAVAERAEFMASNENLRTLKLSVAAQIATSYFTILQYDLCLDIALKTLASRQKSAELTNLLAEYGESTQLEVEQNNGLIATAKVAVQNYTMARNQAIMSLNTLLGRNPTQIETTGSKLLNYQIPQKIPTILPASLLERRSDIKEEYYKVQAAYAQVGVAIASRLPSFTVSAEGGSLTSAFSSLLKGGTYGWSAGLSLIEPLFSFGKLKRNVEIAEQEKVQSLLNYKEKVITALSEVENALIGIKYLRSQLLGQSELVIANKEYQSLTEELYNGGETDFLAVLDAQREYFASQLDYVELLSEELSSYVTLYKSLGGGW